LLARALLGAGDALTFVSVLRYAARHFSARRYPLLVALTAVLGTLGNVAATLPLSAVLHDAGWPAAFFVASGTSALIAVLVVAFVDDPTPRPTPIDRRRLADSVRAVGRRVAESWALPGTRAGFWTHFTCMASAGPLTVLWGHPFLVEAHGFSTADASAVLMVAVIATGVATPTIGVVTGRWPATRIPLALGITVVSLALLGLLIEHPDLPRPVVGVVFVVLLLGGPVSMVAFAVTRDYNTHATLGTASGTVNVAGWTGTVVGCVLFGVVLDVVGGSAAHAMRWALVVLVAVQLFGVVRLAIWYRRLRDFVRRRQDAGEPVPVPIGRRMWFDVRELEGPAAPE
jgi:predicted MFS family arabinose efflux permease